MAFQVLYDCITDQYCECIYVNYKRW